MRLSHEVVVVIALIIELFIVTRVPVDAAPRSPPTDASYDASVKSSTDTLNYSPPAAPLQLPSDSSTIQIEPLKSPSVSLKSAAERENGCSACQQQQQQPATPGDTLTCHIISGIFAKDRLSIGSHVVTAIPQHACKINITGTAIAHGHLVLTTSSGDRILTGHQPMTTRRRAAAAGTDFTFYANEKSKESPASANDNDREETATQYIVADGPLDEGINVRVVKELDRGATEILYTYTIPKRNQSTVTYHRARHHRNPRATSLLNRHDPAPIHSSSKSHPGEASRASTIASGGVDTTAKMEEISATKPKDDIQPQNDQPYLQPGSKDLGHDGVLGHRKWNPNWNPYPAGRPEQFPNGLMHHPAVQTFPDSRRHLPEVYRSPAVQPFYAPLHPVPLSRHQSPPMRNDFMQPFAAFSQPETGLQTPEAAFHKPEVSLSQEDVGLDKPLERFAKPETKFSQPEVDTTESGASDEDQNDYDLQAETGYRDHGGEGGGGPQRPGFDPGTQLHLTNYLQGQGQSQGHGYAFYPAGERSDLLEIPIYQRRALQSSSDPGIVYHAQFYRNSFSPDVAGHSLRVYDPQSQPTHPEWPHPSLHRSADGSNAAESRLANHHPQVPPPPPPPGPGFNRPDLAPNRHLVAADDDIDSYDDYDDEDEDEEEEEDDDDVYAWKIVGFTNCSRTCGGGMQTTMIICVKMGTTPVRVTDENCDVGGGREPKPTSTNVTCNNRPCQPSWEASDWGPCSTSCDLGRQVRKVECRQRISSAAVVMVTAARCQHESRPEVARDCNADRPCYAWKTTEWSECSAVCGKGRRTREVTCATSDDHRSVDESKCAGSGMNGRPTAVEDCQMEECSKSWYHSRWPTQCSSDCGDGVHSRRVHCGADDKKCNEKTKPPTTKECRSAAPCGGTWFVSPWTPCSVSCGDGVKRRDVVCVKKLDKLSVIVNDENCIESERVEAEEPCSEGTCPPTWFTTDWSECSRTCNTGVQTREAKCLDDKERLSQSCDPLDKPELKQTCNTNPCASKLNKTKAQALVVTCRDQLKTCRIVVQARLCRYNVYKESCCFSCTSRGYGEETATSETTSETTIKS